MLLLSRTSAVFRRQCAPFIRSLFRSVITNIFSLAWFVCWFFPHCHRRRWFKMFCFFSFMLVLLLLQLLFAAIACHFFFAFLLQSHCHHSFHPSKAHFCYLLILPYYVKLFTNIMYICSGLVLGFFSCLLVSSSSSFSPSLSYASIFLHLDLK